MDEEHLSIVLNAIKTATADQDAKLAEAEQWREAVEDLLINNHIGTADSFPDPRQAVRALIDFEVGLALDPTVSADARKLVLDVTTKLDTAVAALKSIQNQVFCSTSETTVRDMRQVFETARDTLIELGRL